MTEFETKYVFNVSNETGSIKLTPSDLRLLMMQAHFDGILRFIDVRYHDIEGVDFLTDGTVLNVKTQSQALSFKTAQMMTRWYLNSLSDPMC